VHDILQDPGLLVVSQLRPEVDVPGRLGDFDDEFRSTMDEPPLVLRQGDAMTQVHRTAMDSNGLIHQNSDDFQNHDLTGSEMSPPTVPPQDLARRARSKQQLSLEAIFSRPNEYTSNI